jgi:hypothetical protein
LLFIAFLYLFVCVDPHEAGCLSSVKRFLWETLPNALRKLGSKVCGDRFVKAVDSFFEYVFFKPNPIVQIIYLFCAVGGFYLYVEFGFPHVPNQYMANYHKYIGTCLALLCYYSYYKACAVDPGYLDSKTDARIVKKY